MTDKNEQGDSTMYKMNTPNPKPSLSTTVDE
jgi:hypothetical protein